MELTTVDACRIAGIARQRFNEFVASGDYPCAPPTIAGKARSFSLADVVALYVFARELEARTKPINAGVIASFVHAAMIADEQAPTCSYGKLSNGRPFVGVPVGVKLTDKIDGAWILSLTTINLAAVSTVVRAMASNDDETGELVEE